MVLIGVFALVLVARVLFAFQTPFFSSDEAYLHVRYVEHILETGKPLWHDELGAGGRTLVLSPVFDYILAGFALLMPLTVALKFIPNIFASLLVFPAYLIGLRLAKKEWVALFTAVLAGFVPVFFAKTVNQVSPLSLAVPLFFFLVYAWLKVPQRSWVFAFLAGLLVFVFLHPLSLVLVLSIAIYVGLTRAEKFKQSRAELELALFSLFFVLWAQFLLYKKLIVFHGPAVIWQNIPLQLLSEHFAHISVLGALWKIGLFPLIGGTYVLYRYAFRERQRDVYVLFSFSTTIFALLWLRLVAVETGLMMLGVFLVLLFGDWLILMMRFLQKTKLAKWKHVIVLGCLLLVLASSLPPLFTETRAEIEGTISADEVAAFEWIAQETGGQETVIAPMNYGNYVTALAKRKNVIDSYFLLDERVNEKLTDVNRLYRTVLETEAVELFDKYNATYLYVPDGMHDIGFAGSDCFYRVYTTSAKVYEKDASCHIRVVS